MKNLTPQQVKKLKKLAAVLDNGNVAILEHLFELEESIDEKLEKLDGRVPNLDAVLASVRGKKGEQGEKGEKGDRGEPGKNGRDGIDGRNGKDGKDGLNGKDGKNGVDGKDGQDGKDGADGHIKDLAPQEVRDLLELLQDDERLSISAIKDLREELDALKKQKSTVSGGGIVGRDIFKDYDLSPYLDGVTKTFSIPAVWNIISVHTSSFPNALRKNIDFTYTPQSITFTDEIDAATTLATGQTVVLTIVTG